MKLTKNFSLSEFDCHDGTKVPEKYIPNAKRVAENLQTLRDHLGVPVRITGSGYRTVEHNKKVGGAKNSQHLTCSAADINAEGYTPKQLKTAIEKLISSGIMEQGGIGLYKGFVHYDVYFDGKHARRWNG